MPSIYNVQSIIREIGNGATNPLIATLSDSTQTINAIIKTKGNPEGIRPLVNEYICYQLAYQLGIRMPFCGIASITAEVIDKHKNFLQPADFGSCFFSEYIPHATLPNVAVISSVANKEIFEQIILFDHIIYNKDRNPGNLLMLCSKNEKYIYVIDHSHVFKNQAFWDRFCFAQGMQENDFGDRDILHYNAAYYNMFSSCKNINLESLYALSSRYKEVLTPELLNKIIKEIPTDWQLEDNDMELASLVKYILYRVEHLDEMCIMIDHFMNGGGFV